MYQAQENDKPLGKPFEGFVTFEGGVEKIINDRSIREGSKKALITPPPGVGPGASYGGSATLDQVEAKLAAQLRIAKMRNDIAKLESETAAIEGRAPAFGGFGATGAPVAPTVTGGHGKAAPAGKGGTSSGASRSAFAGPRRGMSYNKVRA